MNFSEQFKQNNYFCRFSPDGMYIANCVQYRLIVREVKTLQIVQLFTNLDAVQYMEWSSDSAYILCGMYKRSLIQVWSLEQPDWRCKIDEGSAGLTAVRWSPDARHILSTAEFQIRITVWSLVNKSVSYIKYPKHGNQGLDFSKDGTYMALAERRNCKDFVSIFACESWQMLQHFEVETRDLADISWSPDGKVLCIWDSLLDYKVFLYSLDGRCLAAYNPYSFALGVKTVTWSPSSQFLVIGSYDNKCRVLNHVTWKTVAEHSHPHTIQDATVIVYKEIEKKPGFLKGESVSSYGYYAVPSKYEVQETPVQIPIVKADPEKPNPKIGVGHVSFSNSCRFMATRNDNMPNTLWIWDVLTLKLATVLIQISSIKAIEWDPVQDRLALCTGNNKLYFWSAAGCVSVEVPSEALFQVNSFRWHHEGNSLVLLSKDRMCLCFLTATDT